MYAKYCRNSSEPVLVLCFIQLVVERPVTTVEPVRERTNADVPWVTRATCVNEVSLRELVRLQT